MHYNHRAQNVHCFSCGVTYDIYDLIGMDYGLADFSQKVEKVRELFGYAGSSSVAAITVLQGDLSDSHDYFLARGITEESCKKHGLFQRDGRAYFPVEGGGWCARAIDDALHPRYKNSFGPLGLWNGELLTRDGENRRLFVTEGIVDAICLEQLGECSLSLCGSQNGGKLLRRCEDHFRTASSWRFVICGDPDDAGHKMNDVLKQGLSGMGISCEILPLVVADGDVGAIYQREPQRLSRLIAELPESMKAFAAPSAAEMVESFFEERQKYASTAVMVTGFAALDKLLDGGLHPGLYVLGAISSLGKTSLALQIADHIAASGGDVLFFSVEQSRSELLAKSLSRTSAQLGGGNFAEAFTSRQLLSGSYPDTEIRRQLLHTTKSAYSQRAKGLYIQEGIADIGVSEIRAAARGHREHTGRSPAVVVDYLQILKPADPRATDKQNTDRAVVELKRISRDFDIPVIAVSSFNRENYRAAVSMEAFKESGAVEYSSDVLIGMQLHGAGTKDFDVNAEKAREPRRIELVMLKNRNGIPYAKIPLRYYAKFSLFQEGRTALPAKSVQG